MVLLIIKAFYQFNSKTKNQCLRLCLIVLSSILKVSLITIYATFIYYTNAIFTFPAFLLDSGHSEISRNEKADKLELHQFTLPLTNLFFFFLRSSILIAVIFFFHSFYFHNFFNYSFTHLFYLFHSLFILFLFRSSCQITHLHFDHYFLPR